MAAKKIKKGQLRQIAADNQGITATSTTTSRSKGKSNKKTLSNNNSNSSGAFISPDLADWMASQQQENDTSDNQEDQDDTLDQLVDSVVVGTTTTSEQNNFSRRQKQNLRQEQETAREGQAKGLVEELEKVLERKTGEVEDILNIVQSFLNLSSTSTTTTSNNVNGQLKQLFAGRNRYDFRLAWVGSDDAICHVGTGLHKVPLARLQEVFLSCLGKNRFEILEVIRILGPFPNVKNTLQGSTSISSSGNSGLLQIVMDRMVDGTGKEVEAGTADNLRKVPLQVEFCNEHVIVAVIPQIDAKTATTTRRSNPFEEKGKYVLVFVKEEDLDKKLDSLRVS